jgi:hypothetical protein
MNLDETSVSCAPEQGAGLIVLRSSRAAKASVRKQDCRTNFSYVGVVCDNGLFQVHMPHFLIASKFNMTLQQLQELQRSQDSNMHVWRSEKSAWNNHYFMQRILTAISKAVSHLTDFQPVLIIDVAPCPQSCNA